LTFALGVTLAFLFLDSPWRWIVIAVLAAVEVFEILLWLKLRRLRSMTGPEGLVGAVGRALTDCKPSGQVRVKGAIWKAHSDAGAAAGEEIVVTAIDGLQLEVRRRSDPHSGR
jgi:membrane-bound ClpP family serine protease